ncbi:tRNA splicing endonuclease subunit SEN34 PWA37_004521 [Arxiozyma heterogenica]|uniref:tRNA-splicing endonuclease subunit Sen34 n=1 Tax=Arxiozyma heterogenica TaxID=278026 RepID=A0AAN7WSJ4_9SACH|nr:hypothetical protein RI543_000809 [Kazachstania heterogenica]
MGNSSLICIRLIVNDLNDDESTVCPMVFSVDDVLKLRKLGICGILSGTLPTATQQNIFLSIPLKLMVEETIWLVLHGYAKLDLIKGPMSRHFNSILESKSDQLWEISRKKLLQSFELQREYKKEQHELKLKQLGLEQSKNDVSATSSSNDNNKFIESSLFVETSNVSSILDYSVDEKREITKSSTSTDLLHYLITNYSTWNNYLLYQSLKEQSYVMLPGGRFGGLYIAYPGDPLRYHSHLTIDSALDYYNDPIDFISLTSGARLGTAVKKLWVIGGVKENKNHTMNETINVEDSGLHSLKLGTITTSFFSIEWAGFG